MAGEGGDLECLAAQVVDGAEVAAGELEDGFCGLVVEEELAAVGDRIRCSMYWRDSPRLSSRRLARCAMRLETASNSSRLRSVSRGGCPARTRESTSRESMSKLVRIRSMPSTSGRSPSLVWQDSKRSWRRRTRPGVGPGRCETAGRGDLAAEVALGDGGDLDVMHPVAGLGQPRGEGTQQGGLARGRSQCQQYRALAMVDGSREVLHHLIEVRAWPAVRHGDLSCEGGLVEAEVGSQGGAAGRERARQKASLFPKLGAAHLEGVPCGSADVPQVRGEAQDRCLPPRHRRHQADRRFRLAPLRGLPFRAPACRGILTAVDNRSFMRHIVAVGNRRIGFAGYVKREPFFVTFRTQGVRRRGFRFFVPTKKGR